MSEAKLDQLVKGAPPPTVTAPQVAAAVRPTDPTSLLPSSPPQIYLNLLILEASLRSQYLTLRARRRQNTFVLTLLALWTASFGYALFLRPREDGTGVGGSVYWVVDTGEKLAFTSGIVTAVLFWATGQWERGVRWPRRWIAVANRGLRSMNCKIVLIKGPWWREMVSHLSFLIPYQLFFPTPGSSYHYVEPDKKDPRLRLAQNDRVLLEEDVAPGGDYVKLLLLPKPFSADFRQNWEIYRTEYWEKENERRAELRGRIKQRERELAKQEGGWLWWTGWRGWNHARGLSRGGDVEKPHHHHHHHAHSHSSPHLEVPKDKKRRPSVATDRMIRERSHSRSSSRSTTPILDSDEKFGRERRWSNSTTGSATNTERRKKKPASGLSRPSRLTPTNSMSRPKTPNSPNSELDDMPAFSKRASVMSTVSTDSDRSATLTPDEKSGSATPSL
ncbi:Nem1-Spo7 phosphatase regulatory subunit [Diplodia intermedia]|uniref:Nem1-Spo7 phosphatase regulatory subunit n=1 Tax=Diplodia intermedia TaxID=856260 RepID=A0ABR3TZQ6_9PEZI